MTGSSATKDINDLFQNWKVLFMAVRKTESRIPESFNPNDLGEAFVSSDNQSALVSFCSSPITLGRRQKYVVFVLDSSLQSSVETYHWQVGAEVADTVDGIWEFTPPEEGNLEISVSLLDNSDAVLRTLSLSQAVTAPNTELEDLIARADAVHPIAANPDTSREIINDHRAYMDELAPRDADPSSSLNRLIFAISYVESMEQPGDQRNLRLEEIAAAFDADDSSTFTEEGGAGLGVCRIRPHVLGMYLPETPGGSDWYLSKREYPKENEERLSINQELLEELMDLPEDKQIDLFNLLRFPKSNLKMAIQLLEGLNSQYFPGSDLETLINDKEQVQSLLDQFKQGPYQSI